MFINCFAFLCAFRSLDVSAGTKHQCIVTKTTKHKTKAQQHGEHRPHKIKQNTQNTHTYNTKTTKHTHQKTKLKTKQNETSKAFTHTQTNTQTCNNYRIVCFKKNIHQPNCIICVVFLCVFRRLDVSSGTRKPRQRKTTEKHTHDKEQL